MSLDDVPMKEITATLFPAVLFIDLVIAVLDYEIPRPACALPIPAESTDAPSALCGEQDAKPSALFERDFLASALLPHSLPLRAIRDGGDISRDSEEVPWAHDCLGGLVRGGGARKAIRAHHCHPSAVLCPLNILESQSARVCSGRANLSGQWSARWALGGKHFGDT